MGNMSGYQLGDKLDGTNRVLVCEKCGENAGICDRCYEMDKTCKNTEHVLTRYVVYKGEKNISKQFTEKDCCQFCKEQLGEGVFYCESSELFLPFCSLNLIRNYYRLLKVQQRMLRRLQ